MQTETLISAFKKTKAIQEEVANIALPPSEGKPSLKQNVVTFSLVRGTRGYIEKITHQINNCYENACYDACAVMIRRLVETLIIEVFEHYSIAVNIQTTTGDFLFLRDLVDKTLSEPSWNLSRNTKKSLPKLKDVGDKSAHSRRFNAVREDIDKLIDDLRVVVQELITLANLKKVKPTVT